MLEICIIVVAMSLAGVAEWRHHKIGNGKRFEKIIDAMREDS